MTARREILARLPIIFGLSAEEAAAAIGVSASLFRSLVEERKMPRPRMIRGRLVWDVDEVRASFKDLPHEGGEPGEVDTWADVV